MPSVAPLARVVLITGSSTGFGRNLVDAVLARGDIAVATLRKPEVLQDLATQFGKDRLLVLPLDVTDKGQVTSVFDAVKTAYGRLDVVVNNAGIAYTNEIEGTTDADIRRLFGPSRLLSTALQESLTSDAHVQTPTCLRPSRSSSKPSPSCATSTRRQEQAAPSSTSRPTAASGPSLSSAPTRRASLRSRVSPRPLSTSSTRPGTSVCVRLSDSLAVSRPLSPSLSSLPRYLTKDKPSQLHLIEPGAFRTNISANAAQPPPHPAYSSPHLPTNLVRAKLAASTGAKGDPAKAARAILDVLDLPREERPKRLALGEDGYALVVLKARELLEGAEKWKDVSLSVNFDE